MAAPWGDAAPSPARSAGMGGWPVPEMLGGMGGSEVHAHMDFKLFTMSPRCLRGSVRRPKGSSAALWAAWAATSAESRGVPF